MFVSANGTKLTSNAFVRWQEARFVGWHCIAPSNPMQNGFVVSLNGRDGRLDKTRTGLTYK